MHLCYLDESGTSQIPGNTSHYVLAGIQIPAIKWKFCDNAIQKIKRKYKLEKAEIHTAWLLRPYPEQKKIPKFDSLDYSKRRLAVNKFRKKELLRLQKSKPKTYRQLRKNYAKTQDYIHLTYKQRENLVLKLSQMVSDWNFSRLFAECIDKILILQFTALPLMSSHSSKSFHVLNNICKSPRLQMILIWEC